MSDRHSYDTFDAFLTAIVDAGVRGVSLRTVHEIRPKQLENHRVEVGPQQWVELSGYAEGVVHAAKLERADAEALERALTARGLAVKKSSANIT